MNNETQNQTAVAQISKMDSVDAQCDALISKTLNALSTINDNISEVDLLLQDIIEIESDLSKEMLDKANILRDLVIKSELNYPKFSLWDPVTVQEIFKPYPVKFYEGKIGTVYC